MNRNSKIGLSIRAVALGIEPLSEFFFFEFMIVNSSVMGFKEKNEWRKPDPQGNALIKLLQKIKKQYSE